ncbi:MAG: hypothetical protein JW751_19455 [Polyangiaceae bacterium]|nr:hypothetical protein [Polyangiaceae bacterium]
MGTRAIWVVVALSCMLSCVRPVLAQSSADRALAEALYDEGRRLMTEGRYADACAKLYESQRLDPATGTLLNLAACREQEGKLATAWLLFKDAAAAARRDGRQDRVEYAEKRAEELSPRVSRLTIEVPAGAALPGLEVKLDGVVVRSAAWGLPTPLDGGTHVVEAAAPGHAPFRGEVQVGVEQANQSLEVPVLAPEAEPRTSTPTTAPSVVAAPDVGTPVGEPVTVPVASAPASPSQRGLGIGVYVAGGLTLGLAASAVVTAVVANGLARDFDEANADPNRTVPERQDLHDEAKTMQIANTALSGVAIVGAAVTTFLILKRPRREVGGGRWRVATWASTTGGGVVVGGAL